MKEQKIKFVIPSEMESDQFLPTFVVGDRYTKHCIKEIQLYCAGHNFVLGSAWQLHIRNVKTSK